MKTNKTNLSKFGFSEKTIESLSESQVNALISSILNERNKKETKEATTKTQQVKTTDYTASEVADMQKKGEGVNVSNGEVTPLPGGGVRVLQKSGKSEAPKNKVIKDGEMSEGKKKTKYNPWAICTKSVGRKDKEKYEKCVTNVKDSLDEGVNPYEVLLEQKIEKLILNNVQAKISKKDFLSLLENKKMNLPIGKISAMGSLGEDTKTAPAKPKVKPDTRPRPSHPGKNPSPGEQPGPKAVKEMGEDTKTAPAKPKVKPDTRPRPSHPGKNPSPGEQPSPKAMDNKKDEFMDVISKILNNR